MTSQLSLFNMPTLNVLPSVKERMAAAAKGSGMSREQLCDRMNELADRYGVRLAGGRCRRLNLDTLEKWLNPNNSEHFPSIKALPVFCAATGDISPMQAMVDPLGGMVINDQDARLLQWARLFHSARETNRRMKKLEAEL